MDQDNEEGLALRPADDRACAPTGLSRDAAQAKPLVPSAGLSAMERETLSAWREQSVGYGFGFNAAAERCNTPRQNIRRAVRSLARKGMLEFCRTLYWEDDGKIGAGYTLTEAGADALSSMENAL